MLREVRVASRWNLIENKAKLRLRKKNLIEITIVRESQFIKHNGRYFGPNWHVLGPITSSWFGEKNAHTQGTNISHSTQIKAIKTSWNPKKNRSQTTYVTSKHSIKIATIFVALFKSHKMESISYPMMFITTVTNMAQAATATNFQDTLDPTGNY